MRLAILSDIHGNLEALECAVKEIKHRNIDSIFILGDIVGYGADPNACIDLCREMTTNIITGNHDYAVNHKEETKDFNEYAAKAISWTIANLNDENRNFLKSLPLIISWENILFIHSSPLKPENWDYIIKRSHAEPQFAGFSQNICFIGHTHKPAIFKRKSHDLGLDGIISLLQNDQYVINVGSVGQPRDDNTMLSLGIFDDQYWTFELVRLIYDNYKSAQKILDAGLPSILAERLMQGF